MPIADIDIDKTGLCYLNNQKLKKAFVKIPFTREQIDEHIRCQQDPVYFAENYIKIVSLDHGLVNFKLYPYQKEMIESFEQNRFSINLLCRQAGKTTVVGAYILHYAIFNKNKRIAVLANKGDTAREILSRIKSMFEDLPWFLKPGVVEWNKGSIEFSNGTRIVSASTSNSGIRGQSMNLIYLDEMAFIQNDVEFFTSTYPVISAGKTTKVIITSTPNGMNLFYKMWMDAVNGKSAFVPKKYLWDSVPGRDEAWKIETLRNISQKQFDQEFMCVTGDTKVTVRDTETGIIKEISIESLYHLMM